MYGFVFMVSEKIYKIKFPFLQIQGQRCILNLLIYGDDLISQKT